MSAWNTIATDTVEWEPVTGTWVDLSPWVLTVERGQPVVTQRGRQTELTGMQPGRLTALTLNNDDGRFTSANIYSPYWPYWVPGKRIRIRETIAGRAFDTWSGYLEIPEVVIQAEGLDQTVTVTAVDRLGRLDRDDPMVSTLAEHIIANAGPSLRAYYPLGEPTGPCYTVAGTDPISRTPGVLNAASEPDRTFSDDMLRFAGGDRVPADDLTPVRFAPHTSAATGTLAATSLHLAGTLSPSVTGSSGQVVTVVCWIKPDPVDVTHKPFALTEPAAGSLTECQVTRDVAIGSEIGWQFSGLASTSVRRGGWLLIGAQVPRTSGTRKLWINGTVWTDSGSIVAGRAFTNLTVGAHTPGSIAHLQIYAGNAGDWPFEARLAAQYAMGFAGLEGQSTGQRIATLAGYAGIPAGELALDPGVAVMQRAQLAGVKPVDAMRVAETTEQGRLFVGGRGLFTFHDRQRIYNI